MENNDILRRIRYTFDIKDPEMVDICALGKLKTDTGTVISWLKKEEDPGFVAMTDFELASFLNGFITHRRGPKDGPDPVAEQELNNNLILRKLKIALELRNEAMIEIFDLVDMRISPHELTAFFRKVGHSKYRECKDQFLRTFLQGMQKRFHPQD